MKQSFIDKSFDLSSNKQKVRPKGMQCGFNLGSILVGVGLLLAWRDVSFGLWRNLLDKCNYH